MSQLADTALDALGADHRSSRLLRRRCLCLNLGHQTPTGCHTVFISMKAVMRYGLISPGASFTTRLTLSAAAFSLSVTSSSVQPATSIAFTSMCDASQGRSSLRYPLRT